MKPKRRFFHTFNGSAALTAVLVVSVASAPRAVSASATWNGSTDAIWATTANWSATPVPGSGDTATFNNAGGTVDTIDLGAGIVLRNLTFDTASAAAYTIGAGAVGSQSLTLEDTGALTMNAAVVTNQLFNSNLNLGNAAGNEAFTITNNKAAASNTLTFAGGLSTAQTGIKTVTIAGTGIVNISGAISNGSGTLALNKSGAQVLALSGNNSYSGGTTITGIVNATTSTALGTGGVTINGAANNQLQLGSGTNISNAITANGGGITAQGVLYVPSGNATFSGTLNATAVQNAGGFLATAGTVGNTLTIAGNNTITTAAAVPLTIRNGAVVITGSQSYTTGTTMNGAAFLQFGKTTSMPATGAVTTIANGLLAVNAGGVGEFTAGTGAGTIGGLIAGTGGQGAAVTWVANTTLGIDTTNAASTVSHTAAWTPSVAVGLIKLGTGTLELKGGGTYASTATIAGFPFIARQGTLLLNGGTHTVTGELVVGGTFGTAAGAAGFDAKLQVDSGSLTSSSWLSIGRGNGVGGVSSDLVLNNAATVTGANMSAGFNGGSGANLPKGTITLNNTSSLTINTNGAFQLAEGAGSNFTMTLNDSSTVNVNGVGSATNRYIGNTGATGSLTLNGSSVFTAGNSILNVGYQTGSGTLNLWGGSFTNSGEVRVGATNANGAFGGGSGTINMTGGTATVGALTLGRGNDATSLLSGTMSQSGGIFNSTSTVIVGYRGGASNSISITGGTFNANGGLQISVSGAAADAVTGTVTVGSGGVLNLSQDSVVGLGGTQTGKLAINGGTVNLGLAATKWLMVGAYDAGTGQLDISNGDLKLGTNSSIILTRQNNRSGVAVINQTGGNVTFYSDNNTTIGGTGALDMQYSATGTASSSGTYNLNGGTLTVPQVSSTATTGTRTFNFNGGTLKAARTNATFFNLGTGSATANVRNGGALINTNGFDVTVAQPLLHSAIGGDNATDGGLTKSGAGTLTLTSASTYTGATVVNGGTLALTGGASLSNGSGITINGSGAKFTQSNLVALPQNITLTEGTFESNGTIPSLTVANSATNVVNPGAGSAFALSVDNAVTFQGAAVANFHANGAVMEQYIEPSGTASMTLTTPGDGAANGQVTVNVTNSGIWAGNTDYPLISYDAFSGTLNDFVLNSVPGLSPRQSASLVNTGSSIALHITGDSLRWTGEKSADWTTAAVGSPYNWILPSSSTGAEFLTGDVVLFDDNAINYSVNVAENVLPGSVVFDNSTTYTVSSSGGYGIAGGTVSKINSGTVVLTTTNSYTGVTTVNGGTLQIGDGSTDGSITASSKITVGAGGTLALNIAGAKTYGNLAGSGVISKAGAGSLTINAASTLTAGGTIQLTSGTLNVNHASAVGDTTAGSLTITGGTLNNSSGAAITTTTAKAQTWAGDFSFAGANNLSFNKGTVTISGGTRTVNVAAGILNTGKIVSTDNSGLSLTGSGLLSITTTDGNFSNLTGPLSLAAGSTLSFNTGADAANTSDLVVTELNGSGTLQNGGGVERWFFLNSTVDHTFNGTVQNGAAGSLGFVKDNTSSFQFANVQSFTGRMTIRNGTMVVPVLADAGVNSSIGAGNQLYLGEGYGTQAGSGTLLYGGGNITTNRTLNISCTAGYSGVIDSAADITFTGAVNADDTGGFIKRGTGTLTFSNAATTQKISNGTNGGTSAFGLNVAQGKLALKTGTYAVTGEMVVGGQLQTGGAYTASAMDITNGGIVNAANWISIGRGNGSTGLSSVVTVDGGTLTQSSTSYGLAMGYDAGVAGFNAAPVLAMKGASTVNIAGSFNLGESAGSDATVTMQDSAVLNLNGATQANKSVGVNGNGTLTVTNGTVNATTVGFTIGKNASGVGVVNLNGGVIDTGSIVGGAGSSTLRLNGGTLRANAASLTFLSGITTVSVDSGAIIDTQSYNVSAQALSAGTGSGGLSKSGTGTLTLSGVNTYVGNTTVNAGVVALADNAGLKFVIGANGVSNKVTGAGSSVLDGDFTFDLSGAAIANGNAWTIVDSTTKSFTTTFTVVGFDDSDLDNVWTMVDGNKTWSFSESTGVLSLQVSAGGFGSWITGFGLAGTDQDPTDDPDGDGFNNLMEYLLGGDPNSGDTGIAPLGNKSGSNFVVTFSRSDLAVSGGDVSILLDYGSDLAGWTSVAVPASSGTVSGVNFNITDGSPSDTVTATIPTSSAVKFFARVKGVK